MKKRLISVLLALMVLCAAAKAELIPINISDNALLVDESGNVVVTEGIYDAIFDLGIVNGQRCYSAVTDEGYVLLNEKGRPANGAVYEYLYAVNGTLFFGENGMFGALNSELKPMFDAEFTSLISNSEGGFIGIKTDPYDDKADGLYLIDAEGNESVTGVKLMGMYSEYSEGLVSVISNDNGKYGYLNTSGEWAIKPQYSYAGSFRNGCAVCSQDSGSGLIDKEGNWLLTPKYDYVECSEDAVIAMNYNSGVSVFTADALITDISGQALYCGITGDYLYLMTPEKTMLTDMSGNILFEAGPDALITSDRKGTFLVSEGEWGEERVSLYSENGAKLAGPFRLMYFAGEWNGKGYYCFGDFDPETAADGQFGTGTVLYGLIDENGTELLPCEYIYLEVSGEGIFTAFNEDTLLLYRVEDGQRVKIR